MGVIVLSHTCFGVLTLSSNVTDSCDSCCFEVRTSTYLSFAVEQRTGTLVDQIEPSGSGAHLQVVIYMVI